ncbi:MAG TPA: MerR family transcriptional regulator [Rhizomicrobium sp.]|nr:MerR family transcriptional regulator [Rhizomicrobium sp.]
MNLSPTEVARRFGVSIKALRLYERRGLLKPLRSKSGWRTYGPDQIARLHQILALKRLGLPLASIGQLLASADTLDGVLALQDQALVQEGRRIAKALALIRKARVKLRSGQSLSVDDLATLSKETSMASKLTRSTLFHPALVPHQHKYFTPEELESLASGEDFDQEADIAVWVGLIAELRALAAGGDPASPEAHDLARRWVAHTRTFTKGDQILETKLRNMVKDAFADPITAQQMPYSKEDLVFLGKIFESLTAPA